MRRNLNPGNRNFSPPTNQPQATNTWIGCAADNTARFSLDKKQKEEKELLLKDVCPRLHYGVKTEYFFDEGCGTHRKVEQEIKKFL